MQKSVQFLLLEIKKWFGLQSFGSTGDWYGQTVPDIGSFNWVYGKFHSWPLRLTISI